LVGGLGGALAVQPTGRPGLFDGTRRIPRRAMAYLRPGLITVGSGVFKQGRWWRPGAFLGASARGPPRHYGVTPAHLGVRRAIPDYADLSWRSLRQLCDGEVDTHARFRNLLDRPGCRLFAARVAVEPADRASGGQEGHRVGSRQTLPGARGPSLWPCSPARKTVSLRVRNVRGPQGEACPG
jgi:hypothetical protein